MIKITIDNQVIEVEKGKSILQAAEANNIYIPTLCSHKDLSPYGGCRMCLVEVDGIRGFPTACTTPAEDGMTVRTESKQLHSLRVDILELILSEHPTNCLFCAESEDCAPYMYTVRKGGVVTGCNTCPKNGKCELQDMVRKLGLDQITYPFTYRNLSVETYDPFYDRDYNLCIYCGRCIRECQEVRLANVLSFKQRGNKATIGPAFEYSHLEAGCEFCGACVAVCPTGALSEKTSKWMGKADLEVGTTCPLCGLGCQLVLQVKNDEVLCSLPGDSPLVNNGRLCVKGRFSIFETVNNESRLREPLKIVDNLKDNITWQDAVDIAAEKLGACNPDEFGLLISPDCSLEDYYIAQKFTRVAMKSNQIDTTARDFYGDSFHAFLCNLKVSAPLIDLKKSDVILCIGLDSRFGRSVVGVELRKAFQNGAKLITIHPRYHNLSAVTKLWLQPKPGEEIDILEQLVEFTGENPDQKVRSKKKSGIQEIRQCAEILKSSTSPAILIGFEYLQHENSKRIFETVTRIGENIKARIIPLVSHSNLLGSLVMGCYPELLPGSILGENSNLVTSLSKNSEVDFSKLRGKWDRFNASEEKKYKVLYRIGEIPRYGDPIAEFEIYQNFALLEGYWVADLILPSAAFSEEDGTLISGEGRLQQLNKAMQPPGIALPHWQILCMIAQKMGVKGFEFSSVTEIRQEIEKVIPNWKLFSDPEQRVILKDLDANFNEHLLEKPNHKGSADYLLSVHYSEDTYQGHPLTFWVKGLRSLVNEKFLLVSPGDAKSLGLSDKDEAIVKLAGVEQKWPVKIDKSQPVGTMRVILQPGDPLAADIYPAQVRKYHV